MYSLDKGPQVAFRGSMGCDDATETRSRTERVYLKLVLFVLLTTDGTMSWNDGIHFSQLRHCLYISHDRVILWKPYLADR